MKRKRIENKELIDILKAKHVCIICGEKNVDIHHIKTRKEGGPDERWNLVPLCRSHHSEAHSMGVKSFADKYIMFRAFLLFFNWQQNIQGKWFHNNKE